MNEIVPKATLEEIEHRRNLALEKYDRAHAMITAANEELNEAGKILKSAAPAASGYIIPQEERDKIFSSLEVAEYDEYSKIARHMVDADVWSSLIQTSELQILMDKKAKDELRQSLMTDPPEFTVGNAKSTLTKFSMDAGMIFRRGIAEVFTNLDRRFRSHSGWKIGSRVILSNAFDSYGWWSNRNHRDSLMDIERTFFLLDGQKPPRAGYAGIIGDIDTVRGGIMANPGQSFAENEFFKVRVFKNGNLHIWFKRDDLVKLANKMIGEYYGEVIPEERKYDETDIEAKLNLPKFTPAKNHGFFPTPDGLASRLCDNANLYSRDDKLRVLEPQAGTGQLSKIAVQEYECDVDCIEIQADHALNLRRSGLYRNVHNADFLMIDPETTGLYDRVIMNPPFDAERDIDHVMHALKFLKEDGTLVAIMSAHTEFAESIKARAFRAKIEKMNGKFRDNPFNSFASVGTNVNTVMLKVHKDGRSFYF